MIDFDIEDDDVSKLVKSLRLEPSAYFDRVKNVKVLIQRELSLLEDMLSTRKREEQYENGELGTMPRLRSQQFINRDNRFKQPCLVEYIFCGKVWQYFRFEHAKYIKLRASLSCLLPSSLIATTLDQARLPDPGTGTQR